MPHKHKQKADSFNLPPTSLAPQLTSTSSGSKAKSRRSKNLHSLDDTPRAFTQLLNLQRHGTRLPHGLDDGKPKPKSKTKPNRKCKRTDEDELTTTPAAAAASVNTQNQPQSPSQSPHTQPPKPSKNPSTTPASSLIPTEKPTKHNRRLQKLQAGWRIEEARLQTLRAEKREEAAEQESEERALWNQVALPKGKGKKRRREGIEGGEGGPEEDPWAELNRKKWKRQQGLQDVVTAPPVLGGDVTKGLGRRVVRDGAGMESVPKTGAGGVGLRRREELGRMRGDVIREYRRRMGRGGEADEE